MAPGSTLQTVLPLLLLCGCWLVPVHSTICAGLTYYTATTTSATFTSPDYPSDYGINIYCSWLIEATDSSHVIKLTVNSSSLEDPDGDGTCSYDYVRVYDGNDMSDTLLGDWCGSSTATLYSTGTQMLIVFKSDYDTVSSGFDVVYESGTSWETPSSKDYTIIIIASSTSTFFVICLVVAICCIRSRLKKKKAQKAADRQKLEGEEGDEKYQSEGGRSLFTQRILPSRQGKRLQPIEVAVEKENSAVTKVVAANAAASAVAQQKELKEKGKQDKKKAQEKKKAEQKAAKQEQKKKTAAEKEKGAEKKTKAKRGNRKKVGFEEQTEQIGVSTTTDGPSPIPDSAQRAENCGAVSGQQEGSAPGETSRKDKIVLLPTVVMVGSAETLKRQKVEGQWEKVSSNRQDPGSSLEGSILPSDGVPTEGDDGSPGNQAQTAVTVTFLEKDEGIHMDYEGGESGKSSPTSRPPTNTAPRENSVVTPSLVTSVITDVPAHQPIPIEAPSKGRERKRPSSCVTTGVQSPAKDIEHKVDLAIAWPQQWSYKCPDISGNILDGPSPPRASTASGDRARVTTTVPPPVKDAFMNNSDPSAAFTKPAPNTLDAHGKPTAAQGGRKLISR